MSNIYKAELALNTKRLNDELVKLRSSQQPSKEITELLNQRAMLKDMLIEALEAELSMKQAA